MVKKRVHSMRIKNKFGKTEYIEYMIGDRKHTRAEKVIPSLMDWWLGEKALRTMWYDLSREQQEEFNGKPVEVKALLRTNMINEKIMACISKLKEMIDKFEQTNSVPYSVAKHKNFIFSMKALVHFRNEYPEASCLGTTVQRVRHVEHIRVYKGFATGNNIWDTQQIEKVIPEMITPLIDMAEPIIKKALDAEHTGNILYRLKQNKDNLETKRKKYEKSLARLEEVQDLPDDWEGKQEELEDWINAAPDWVGKVQISSNAIEAHKSVPREKESAERRLKWDKEYYENCMKAIANGTAYLAERVIVLEEEE